MVSPLNTEAANADLITDIVAPSPERASAVSDLARDLTHESASWRQAWTVGAAGPDPVDDCQAPGPSATTA